MTVLLEGGCRVSDMRDGPAIVNGSLTIRRQIGRATGAQAISLSVMEFAKGQSPSMRNGEADQILYLLNCEQDETLTLTVDGRSFSVGGDSGIYIRPGETFAFDNPNPVPLVVISSQCPDPDSATEFVQPPAAAGSGDHARIVRLADQRAQPTADRWYRVLVDERVGSAQVTQFVGSIPPGRAPDHFHHYEEVLFILKGTGRMWAGETHTPIAEGACIYLPKGQIHCVENTGAGELRLLGMFYPAGSPSVRYEA